MSSPQSQTHQTPTLNSLLQKRPSLNNSGPGSVGDYVLGATINGGGPNGPNLAPSSLEDSAIGGNGGYYSPATTSEAYFIPQQKCMNAAKFGQSCAPNGISNKLALNSNHPALSNHHQAATNHGAPGGFVGGAKHPTVAALRQEGGGASSGGGRVSPGAMASASSPSNRGSSSPVSQMRHSPISPTPVTIYQNANYQQNSEPQMPSNLYSFSSHQFNGPGQNAFNENNYKFYSSPSYDPFYGTNFANGPSTGGPGGPGFPSGSYPTRYRNPATQQQNGPSSSTLPPTSFGEVYNNNNNYNNNKNPSHSKQTTNQNAGAAVSRTASTNGNSTPLTPNLNDTRMDSPAVSDGSSENTKDLYQSGNGTPVGSDRQRTMTSSRSKMNGSRESHPPTPAPTSPGGASSIHDDQDSSLSSPSWPRTPMSPATMRFQPMGPPSVPMGQGHGGGPGAVPSPFMPSATPSSSGAALSGKETGMGLVQRLLGDYHQSQCSSPQEWEDRRRFFEQLVHFCETKGHPVTGQPTVSKTPVDLYKLYTAVKQNSGFEQVTRKKSWKELCHVANPSLPYTSGASYQLRKHYVRYLLPFECYFDRNNVDVSVLICSIETNRRKNKLSPPSSLKPGNATGSSPSPNQNLNFGCGGNLPPLPQLSQILSESGETTAAGGGNGPNATTAAESSSGVGGQQGSTGGLALPRCDQTTGPPVKRKGRAPKYLAGQHQQYPPEMAPPNLHDPVSSYQQQQQQQQPNPGMSPYPTPQQGRPLGVGPSRTSTEMVTNPFDDRASAVPQPAAHLQHHSAGMAPGHSYAPHGPPVYGNVRSNYVNYHLQQQQQPVQSGFPSGPYAVKTGFVSEPDAYSGSSYHQQQPVPPYGRPPSGTFYPTQNNPLSTNDSSMATPPATMGGAEGALHRNDQSQQQQPQLAPILGSGSSTGNGSGLPPVLVRSQEISPNNLNAPPYLQQQMGSNNNPYNTQTLAQAQPHHQNSQMLYHQQQQSPISGGPETTNQNQQQTYFNNQLAGNVPKNSDPGGQNVQLGKWPSHHPPGKYPSPAPQILPPSLSSLPSSGHKDLRHCVLERVSQPVPFVNAREISMTLKQHPAISPAHSIKRESSVCFSKDSVEATVPCVKKRKKIFAKDLGKIDNKRIVMALKSELWYETAWALNVLNVLLYDDNTAPFFLLSNLPQLLPILIDLYKRLLFELFPLIRPDDSTTRSRDLLEKSHDEPRDELGKPRDELGMSRDGLEKSRDQLSTFNRDECDNRLMSIKREQSIINVLKNESVNYTTISRLGKRVKFCNLSSFSSKFDDEIEYKCEKQSNFDVNLSLKNDNIDKNYDNDDHSLKIKRTKLDPTFNDVNIVAKNCQKSENNDKTLDKSGQNSNFSSQNLNTNSRNSNFCSNKASFFYQPIETVEDSDEIMQISSSLLFMVHKTEDHSKQDLLERLKSISNILRGLSNVPENEPLMAAAEDLISLLASILLLGHCHVERRKGLIADNNNSTPSDKIESNDPIGVASVALNESIDNSNALKRDSDLETSSVPQENEFSSFEPSFLATLVDDSFVVLCQISSHFDLQPLSQSISAPLIDALLHWAVCKAPSSRDPLLAGCHVPPNRYALEILCKLSINEQNVDLIMATPPRYRLELLISRLADFLCVNEETETVLREFAIVLIQTFCCSDQVACVMTTLKTHSVQYLVSFLEIADMEMHKVAQRCGMQALRDNPEVIGTSVGMLRRAANTLLAMSKIDACRPQLFYYQSKLLNFTMSHLMDSRVGATIADVLYEIQKGFGVDEVKTMTPALNVAMDVQDTPLVTDQPTLETDHVTPEAPETKQSNVANESDGSKTDQSEIEEAEIDNHNDSKITSETGIGVIDEKKDVSDWSEEKQDSSDWSEEKKTSSDWSEEKKPSSDWSDDKKTISDWSDDAKKASDWSADASAERQVT